MKLKEAKKLAEALNYITDIEKTLENQNRKWIMKAIKDKEGLTIAEIHRLMQKKTKISYKSVYKNIEVLEKRGLVRLSKDPTSTGQSVTVSETDFKTRLKKIEEDTLKKLEEINR